MKVLVASLLLVGITLQVARAGQTVQGWIIDLSEFPLDIHRNHPDGSYDVIPEEGDEGINYVRSFEHEVNPFPANVTLLTDKEAEDFLALERNEKDDDLTVNV